MLTSDDGGSDGRFRAYLQKPDRWRHFDPELFDGLASILRQASKPKVSLLEGTGLLPRTTFHSEKVPDGRGEREGWCRDLMRAITTSNADLVFFDPDNGIEVPSKPIGRKDSSKYVSWLNIKEVWDKGCSVLVYQHFPRKPRRAFAERLVSELQRRTSAPYVEAFATAHVLFVLATQTRHERQLRKAIAEGLPRWKGQIECDRPEMIP